MFQVGDKIVHPMHGAGVIDAIVQERVAGSTQDYYVFKMPVGGLVLKIPYVQQIVKVDVREQTYELVTNAYTKDTQTVIQREEIEDYIWLEYSRAIKTLKFDNDKLILRKANRYMNETLGIETVQQAAE